MIFLFLLMLAYAVFFSVYTIQRHTALETAGYDLGNVDQALWNTLRGRPLAMTNMIGVNSRWGLHCEPILLLIAPFYWIHSGPETVLVLQTIVVALGALPIFWLAHRHLYSTAAALIFAAVYLLFPALEGANAFDFHAVTMAATFLAFALWAAEEDHYALFIAFAVLTMACKEEMPLIVIFCGVWVGLRKREWRVAGATFALALVWLVIANLVVVPHFSGTGANIHFDRYAPLGGSVSGVVETLVTHPLRVLRFATQGDKAGYLLRLLIPVGFVALLDPLTLTLALPTLAVNLLSSYPPMYALDRYHYSAVLVPIVVVAAIRGARRFRRSRVLVIVVGTTLGYHVMLGYTPLSVKFDRPRVTDHERSAMLLVEQVPSTATVSAQNRLNPHLSQRERIYIFPKVSGAEYIVLDVTSDVFPIAPLDYDTYTAEVRRYLESEEWGVRFAADGLLLLQREAPIVPVPDTFYTFVLTDNPPASTLRVDFGGIVTLVAVAVDVDGDGAWLSTVWRWNDAPVDGTQITVAAGDGPLSPLWYWRWLPPQGWPAGFYLTDTTILWAAGEYRFCVADAAGECMLPCVISGDEGWHVWVDETGQQLRLRRLP